MDPPLPSLANSLASSPAKFPNMVCHVSQLGTVGIFRVLSGQSSLILRPREFSFSSLLLLLESVTGGAAQVTPVTSIKVDDEIQAHAWSQDGRVLAVLTKFMLKIFEVSLKSSLSASLSLTSGYFADFKKLQGG